MSDKKQTSVIPSEYLKLKEEELQILYVNYSEDIVKTKREIKEAKIKLKALKSDKHRIAGALGNINELKKDNILQYIS